MFGQLVWLTLLLRLPQCHGISLKLVFPRTPSPPVLLEPLGLVPSQGTWRQIPRHRCSCPCSTTLPLTLSKGHSFRACYNLLQLLSCELDDSLCWLIWHPRYQCEVASLNLSLFWKYSLSQLSKSERKQMRFLHRPPLIPV